MNDSELYGKTIRVNFARPPKANERSTRPVWADDEWLKQYGHGSGYGEINTERAQNGGEQRGPAAAPAGAAGDAAEAMDAEAAQGPAQPKLPRVYLGVKVGIRCVKRPAEGNKSHYIVQI